MTGYNEFSITWGGQRYIFITRGRSKPIEAAEAIEYLQNRKVEQLEFPNHPIEPKKDAEFVCEQASTWKVADNRDARRLFRDAIQRGMEFCKNKYGQAEDVIKAEAERLGLGGFNG